MSPPRLTEASLHAVRSGTILPTYDRGAHALRDRPHRAGRVPSRAPGVLRGHAAALRQALGDFRAVAQEHRPARRAGPAAGPVHAGGARRGAARARHRRDPRAAGGRDGRRRGICAPHRSRYAHRLAHGHRKRLLPRREEPARRRQCRHRARPCESRQAAQHHRLDRRRSASPPRAGRAAVRGAELRQPAGQRFGAASRAGGLRAHQRRRPRALDRSRSRLSAHHGRQHHAGHR